MFTYFNPGFSNLCKLIASMIVALFILVACGGSGGSASSSSSNTQNDNTAPSTTSASVTPFKGMFVSGTVSVTDANGNSVALLNNTEVINSNGIANITYATNVAYPLIVSVTGSYLNEVSGTAEASATPLRGLILNSVHALGGIPVTAITEIAVTQLVAHQTSGVPISLASAAEALAEARTILGREFNAAASPVFDTNGKTSDPDTLFLAALAVVANTQGTGSDLMAKLNNMAQSLATGTGINLVIPQTEFNLAVSAVNGGAHNMLPSASASLSLRAITLPSTTLEGTNTLKNANFIAISDNLALKGDGTLWAWGDNYPFGSVGNGSFETTVTFPQQIGTGYSKISAGSYHKLALKTDGSLWAWGDNTDGQLGDGTQIKSNVPIQIGTGYSDIAAGQSHSIALKTDGSLWAWGNNDYGQLGDGTISASLSPKRIGTALYSAISTKHVHTIALLKSDNTLWAWGGNFWGQLGDNTKTDRRVPTKIGTAAYTLISTGVSHSVALRGGDLWAWGDNTYQQLGTNTVTESLVPKMIGAGYKNISAGFGETLWLKTDNSLWTTVYGGAPTTLGSGFDVIFDSGNNTGFAIGMTKLYRWVSSLSPALMDFNPPSIPAGLLATGADNTNKPVGVNLSWNASTGSQTVNRYNIYRYGELVGYSTSNTYTDYADLSELTTYSYTVAACYGSESCSDRSNAVGVTTLAKSSTTSSSLGGMYCLYQGSQPGHYDMLGILCLPGAPTTTNTGGSSGSGGSGYQCPTTKPVYDPDWIQSHGSYWAAASAHDAYSTCLQTSSDSSACQSYYTQETQYCNYALPACLAVATNASDCPG